MFVVASRCIAHSFFFLSFITGEDAIQASAWLNDDKQGDDVILFTNLPTMMFSQSTLMRFSDFTWVRADVTATRTPASAWRYGQGGQMLPPVPNRPTTRRCQVLLETAPTYHCTGFRSYFEPVLVRDEGPAHPRRVNLDGDMFQVATLHRQRRTRHIHVTLQEWEPAYPGEPHRQPRGQGDGAQ